MNNLGFDHTKENFHEACGVEKEERQEFINIMVNRKEGSSVTETMENIWLSPKFKTVSQRIWAIMQYAGNLKKEID
jgi:hypothetical protein